MGRNARLVLALWLLCSSALLAQLAGADAPDAGAEREDKKSYTPRPSASTNQKRDVLIKAPSGAPVVHLRIEGTIDLGLSAFIARTLEQHPDAAALVLEINTLGGRVDAAIQIRDALLDTQGQDHRLHSSARHQRRCLDLAGVRRDRGLERRQHRRRDADSAGRGRSRAGRREDGLLLSHRDAHHGRSQGPARRHRGGHGRRQRGDPRARSGGQAAHPGHRGRAHHGHRRLQGRQRRRGAGSGGTRRRPRASRRARTGPRSWCAS